MELKTLRELTNARWEEWRERNCGASRSCDNCLFVGLTCFGKNCWLNHKDKLNDEFLDNQLEVAEHLNLTEDEREELNSIFKIVKTDTCGQFYLVNFENDTQAILLIFGKDGKSVEICTKPFVKGTRYKGLINDKEYFIQDFQMIGD